MFDEISKKQPLAGGMVPVKPPAPATPIISKPPLEQSPFAVKSGAEAEKPPPSFSSPEIPPKMPVLDSETSSRGKFKMIMLIVIILVVLAAVGAGVYYFFFRGKNEGNVSTNQTPVTNQTNINGNINTNQVLSAKDKILAKFKIEPSEETNVLTGFLFSDDDGDGLNNYGESWFFTDGDTADSDKDGYNDGAEVKNGYHPAKAGAKIDLSGVDAKCQNFVGASAQDKFPSAEYRKDICAQVPAFYELQKELGLVIDGTEKDYADFGQSVIDLCEKGGFLSDIMLENCVNFLTEDATFPWAN